MTHPEDLLADYVDGSLSSQDSAVVEAHLASCQRCRDEAALARGAVSALRSLPEATAPAGLGQAAIEEAGGAGSTASPIPEAAASSASRRHRFLAVAAAAAVVAVIAISLSRLTQTNHTAGSADIGASAEGSNTAGGPGSNAKSLSLEIQQTDYDPTTAGKLATAAAMAAIRGPGAPTPAPTDQPHASGSADTQTALSCLQKAFTGFSGDPIRLIQARFQGKAAYIGVYKEGPSAALPSGTVSVRVVAVDGCSLLSYTSAKI
jgi:hypothetical protein